MCHNASRLCCCTTLALIFPISYSLFPCYLYPCPCTVHLGGYNGHTCSDKLFKLVESDWVEIKTNGPLPDGRCGCAYGVSGRFLFVFGGYSPREKHMDEFLRLDLSTMEWRVLSCSNTPLKRAYLQGNNIIEYNIT